MAFVTNRSFKVGDWVLTAERLENLVGYMERGTKVKIIDIGERGYDLEDEEGHRVTETGWLSVKALPDDMNDTSEQHYKDVLIRVLVWANEVSDTVANNVVHAARMSAKDLIGLGFDKENYPMLYEYVER